MKTLIHNAAKILLEQVKQSDMPNLDMGICINLQDIISKDLKEQKDLIEFTIRKFYYILEPIFIRWPDYSGYVDTPVHTDLSINSIDQYIYTPNKWDQTTEYGRKRIELLKFIIEQTKE